MSEILRFLENFQMYFLICSADPVVEKGTTARSMGILVLGWGFTDCGDGRSQLDIERTWGKYCQLFAEKLFPMIEKIRIIGK